MTLQEVGVRAMELSILLIFVDLFLSWVQVDPGRWPRRMTHAIITPLLWGPRALLARIPTGGWDLSPVVLVALLTVLRVWWLV